MTTPVTSTSSPTATPGVTSTPYTPTSNTLNQQDFLTLMTAQLQNQDPLAPMDNAAFMGQMAQFSTVEGISQSNTTLSSINDQMRDVRIATGATMLGHQVLVPSAVTRPDANGTISGIVDLPESADSVTVTYSDANTGQLLYAENIGPQTAGLVGFGWDNVPQTIRDANAAVRVSVSSTNANGTKDVSPTLYAKVFAASASATSNDLSFQVEDYGAVNALQIDAYR
jgi:flagellar basal-body rod modification protein FlgD